MMAIVAQPYRGHLNGNVNDAFDMEECCARPTVAGTRAQSLTVLGRPLPTAPVLCPIFSSILGVVRWQFLEAKQQETSPKAIVGVCHC